MVYASFCGYQKEPFAFVAPMKAVVTNMVKQGTEILLYLLNYKLLDAVF